MNPVTREELEALNAKLDMYIQCQNQREKDFNELERKVYQMEQEFYSPSVTRQIYPISSDGAGIAWLR